jgi:hypothetical protein
MASVLAELSFRRIILLTGSVQRDLREAIYVDVDVDVDMSELAVWSLHGEKDVLLTTGLLERYSHRFVRVTG